MSAELQAHGNLMGGVHKAAAHQKLGKVKVKKGEKKSEEETAAPKGKKPTAKDVRTALKGKHITPAEAADLNPLGGLTPGVKDVRDAMKGGHITPEEGYALNPQSIKSPKSKKTASPKPPKAPKPPKEEKAQGPINVKSERIYPTKGSIEAPRQWKENGL